MSGGAFDPTLITEEDIDILGSKILRPVDKRCRLLQIVRNRIALEYHGLTLDEWRDTAPGALGHPDDSKRVRAIWDGAISTGSAFESEGRLGKSDAHHHHTMTSPR